MSVAAASGHPVRFERLQQLRAHESVAEQIRRHIELRLIGPGDALPPERDLAAMFGVGRATVQHALRLLEDDLLVETRRGRKGGTFVSRPTDDAQVMEELILRIDRRRSEIEQLLVYRATLEPAVAALAAATRSGDDLGAMRRELVRMAAATTELDYMRSDTAFHIAVAGATRNSFLVGSVEDIRARLNDAISLLPETDAWHARLSDEHAAIVAAVERTHEEGAARAMAEHIAGSNQGIRAILGAIHRRRRLGSASRKEERP